MSYRSPVGVVCRDVTFLRELEDALLEDELRVAGPHWRNRGVGTPLEALRWPSRSQLDSGTTWESRLIVLYDPGTRFGDGLGRGLLTNRYV